MENENSLKTNEKFITLVNIMKTLRSEKGCPWDKEQTNESLKNDTLEEVYELVDAINNEDDANLIEEIGDVLMLLVFHSRIASDEGRFTINDVLDSINTKMVRRHPHVFHDGNAKDAADVLKQWDEIKKVEKSHTTFTETLRCVPNAMPALIRANKIGKRAARSGFDFENAGQLIQKLDEEIGEVKEAIEKENMQQLEEEIGDLLFQIVNISRFFHLNAENALTKSLEKFINRFEGIEQLALAKGDCIEQLSQMQLNELWDQVKLKS